MPTQFKAEVFPNQYFFYQMSYSLPAGKIPLYLTAKILRHEDRKIIKLFLDYWRGEKYRNG